MGVRDKGLDAPEGKSSFFGCFPADEVDRFRLIADMASLDFDFLDAKAGMTRVGTCLAVTPAQLIQTGTIVVAASLFHHKCW